MKGNTTGAWLFVLIVIVAVPVGYVLFNLNSAGTRGQGELASSSYAELGPLALMIEVADTEATRQLGLSGRESLAKNAGLLFDFGKSGVHGIWMKDMNFPIDILWLDENFLVVDIKTNADPASYFQSPPRVFEPSVPASYVLEVNAGTVAGYNIKPGDELILSR